MIYTESDISKELDVIAPMLANRPLYETVEWLDVLLSRMNEHRVGAHDGFYVDYSKAINIESYITITEVDLL